MKQIEVSIIAETVARLCKNANIFLPKDVWRALESAYAIEKKANAREILSQLLENARTAGQKEIALCQDTGIAEVFVKIGQDVHITGGALNEAINKGVALGYAEGYLRKSLLNDPLERKNTGDNTPAVIYSEVVGGDKLEITVLPKGGGTENSSAIVMLNPNAGWQGIKEFVLENVKKKGANSCPPLIIGIGIGGTISSVGLLAKKSLLRELGTSHPGIEYAGYEKGLLKEINALGIGPMGLGGSTTALAVHIEAAPCHIASLPVAVNLQCHSLRRLTGTI